MKNEDRRQRRWLAIGAIVGGTAVILGAFARHGLEARLEPEMLTVFETAARYQMYHGLVLCVLASLFPRFSASKLQWAGLFFLAGIVLFCGSLYLLSTTGLRWLGMVTPLGGLSFISGWFFLALAALTANRSDEQPV